MTTALATTYKGWTPAQAAAAIARLPKYAECMSQFNIDIDGNPVDDEATKVNFMDAVDLLELDGIEPPTGDLLRQQTIQRNLRPSLDSAKAAYDLSLVRLMRLQPTDEGWDEAYEEVQVAASVVREYTKAHAASDARHKQQLEQVPAVEQAPEPAKAKSVPQQKAEDNARIARANKGKSAKEKAEALDVPAATVKKVEKAKEVQALAKAVEQGQAPDLKAADLRKLAKELKVDVSKVDFRSKPQRQALQKQLQDKQASAKQWSGLSASRQAELNKLARTNAN